jgi:hypothetical protein
VDRPNLAEWPGGWLRLACEYTFSLNVAWGIVWAERSTHKFLGGHVAANYVAGLLRGTYQIASPVGGHTVPEQLVWSLAGSLVVFCLLRSLSRFALLQAPICALAGLTGITLFPIVMKPSLFVFEPTYRFQFLNIMFLSEVGVVLVCALLFGPRKRFIAFPVFVTALIAHFTLWAWLTSSYINIPLLLSSLRNSAYYQPWPRTLGTLSLAILFNFGFPVIGFLASLTWALYIKKPDSPMPQLTWERTSRVTE